MKYLSKKLFTAFLITFLFGINNVQAFSFNFSSDDDYYGNPYWGNQGWNAPNSISNYRPWIAPDGSKFYPRLPYYQRSKMIESRQKGMQNKRSAMNTLADMLFGRTGFDRIEAIKAARRIETTAGQAMNEKFHPGAIVSYDSKASREIWSQQDAFKANTMALQQAAKALAEEFSKQPSNEEGAVNLPTKSENPKKADGEKVTISPDVWDKFNAVSRTCDSCHRRYRSNRW